MQVILNATSFYDAVRMDDRRDEHEHHRTAERINAEENGEAFEAAGLGFAAQIFELTGAFLPA